MDERLLTEKLIAYDTSDPEGIRLCAGFVKAWLDARDVDTRELTVHGLPVLIADVGPNEAELTLLLHGHIDVVPGLPEQFRPHAEGERLYGRGAYDMKGALATLMLALVDFRGQHQRPVRVRLGVVPDEESEEETERGGDHKAGNEKMAGVQTVADGQVRQVARQLADGLELLEVTAQVTAGARRVFEGDLDSISGRPRGHPP